MAQNDRNLFSKLCLPASRAAVDRTAEPLNICRPLGDRVRHIDYRRVTIFLLGNIYYY